MPAMSTPLKALIQERLRAKIVRQSDEDYDYEGEMYQPAGARVPPGAMHGSYVECKERPLPMSVPKSSSVSSASAASASSSPGFPLGLHTEINPAAYIPHGQPLSARGYSSRHPGPLSPSPSYARHGRHAHQGHYRHHHQLEDDVDMYGDRHAYLVRSHRESSVGLEMLLSPRWGDPPRHPMHITSSSPPPPTRGQLHRHLPDEIHSQRWREKGSAAVHHRSERRRYADDSGDSDHSSRGAGVSMREFRHDRKRERRHEYDHRMQLTSEHQLREANGSADNQLWHNVPMSSSKIAYKSHLDGRESAHSVRPAERPSYASSLAPSMDYTTNKPRFSRRHHHQDRAYQQDDDGDESSPEESMTSLMFLPPPDAREHTHASQAVSNTNRPSPAPLDMSALSASRPKTRSLYQILSPDSRLAANAFVEKRQRRSGKSTPRTMATQSWLRSLDLHKQP